MHQSNKRIGGKEGKVPNTICTPVDILTKLLKNYILL